MGIQYTGGTVQRLLVDGGNSANFVADLKAALVAAGWTAAATSGGWYLTSATTAQFQACRIKLTDSAGVPIIVVQTADGSVSSDSYDARIGRMQIVAGTTYTVITNKYSFWLFIAGTVVVHAASLDANAFSCGVPFIPDPTAPLLVSSATNTSPIVITTSAAHDMTTGDYVFLDQVGGNTAANGLWAVTVTSTTSFSLNTSVGNGAYTSGGLVGNQDRLSRAIYAQSNYNINVTLHPRNGWRGYPGGNLGLSWVMLNEVVYSGYTTDICFVGTTSGYPWRESRMAITEPYVMGALSTGNTKRLQYQLWNATLLSGIPPIYADDTTTFDGHNWQVYGSDDTFLSLLVAYT